MTGAAEIWDEVREREYALREAQVRVAAGQAAADLLAAANTHLSDHGDSPDSWSLAALEAVEALSDLATHGVDPRNRLAPESHDRPEDNDAEHRP